MSLLRPLVIALALAASVAAAAGLPAPQRGRRSGVVKERSNPHGLQQPRGYAHVVTARGGKTVYVAGQLAADEQGNLVGRGDLKAQAQKVFENLRVALRAVGADFEDVVKLNTYVVGFRPEMLDTLRSVRSSFMGEVAVPASTLVGVQALAREGYLIEIEAVAVVD
jgi:enamine deaminase RidA (YjgF/YER057c/UK114 family)